MRIDIGIDMDGAQAEPPPPPPLERHQEAEGLRLTPSPAQRTSILTFRCHSNSTARFSAPPQWCDVPPWMRLDLRRTYCGGITTRVLGGLLPLSCPGAAKVQIVVWRSSV